MNNTILHFYRGTKGMGIVISLRYGHDRIILDFGAPFSPMSEIYDGTVRIRSKNRVIDTLLTGRIPEVPGVFSKEDLKDHPLLCYEESDLNTAIFISHLHLDHMSEIDKVAKDIPVYIHEDGIRLYEALYQTGLEKTLRICHPFTYQKKIQIGEISVTPFFSDHPCPGSSGFLIKTPDATVYYSGDIRFHGSRSEEAFSKLDILKQEKIDLLIVDATTTSPSEFHLDPKAYSAPLKELLPGSISEQDIYDRILSKLKDDDGLGVFNQYDRDTSMMKQMISLGSKLGRTVVFEPEFAYIISQMHGIDVPVIEQIGKDEIRKEPGKYLIQNSYGNILTLSDFDGIKGNYFHLFGEPLVEGTKNWNVMVNIVKKLGWQFYSFSNLYSFSHAYPNQLSYMIDKISAKSVVAVHSKHPEMLPASSSRQYFPKEDKDYLLKDGKLIEM